MTAHSIWILRLSLVWLLITVLIGGLLLIQKVITIHPAMWVLLPVHYELAIWGWLVQFVMGTAYWMFPRYLGGEARGSQRVSRLMAVLFNAGLLLLVISPFNFLNIKMVLFARGLMTAGVMLFVWMMWNRVVSYRNHG